MQADLLKKYEDQIWELAGLMPGTEGLRMRALKAAHKYGMPNKRNEKWHYSDLRAYRDTVFQQAPAAKNTPPLPDALTTETSARLVFINGRFSEDMSDMGDLWQAAQVRPLANHLMSNMDRVDELVRGQDAITCLNTALMRDGMVLSVPAGVEIDDPVEILHIASSSDTAGCHIRHVIELGEGASLTLIERYIGDDSSYWTNSVLQARISEGAHFKHIRLQEEGSNALHTAKVFANVGAEANYTATNINLGGALSRIEVNARLLIDSASATVNGVALAASGQSHDTYTQLEHLMPGTTSDQLFRTVADKHGKTSFQGKVTVAKDAQKTVADQSFKALIFDKTAEANAKPELEILADDVKCSHGATVGQLDEKAIFYLTSRGIDPATARQMLVEAFTADALKAIQQDDVKEALLARINTWMAARSGKAGVEAGVEE